MFYIQVNRTEICCLLRTGTIITSQSNTFCTDWSNCHYYLVWCAVVLLGLISGSFGGNCCFAFSMKWIQENGGFFMSVKVKVHIVMETDIRMKAVLDCLVSSGKTL